jgi:hypothetical protein
MSFCVKKVMDKTKPVQKNDMQRIFCYCAPLYPYADKHLSLSLFFNLCPHLHKFKFKTESRHKCSYTNRSFSITLFLYFYLHSFFRAHRSTSLLPLLHFPRLHLLLLRFPRLHFLLCFTSLDFTSYSTTSLPSTSLLTS